MSFCFSRREGAGAAKGAHEHFISGSHERRARFESHDAADSDTPDPRPGQTLIGSSVSAIRVGRELTAAAAPVPPFHSGSATRKIWTARDFGSLGRGTSVTSVTAVVTVHG